MNNYVFKLVAVFLLTFFCFSCGHQGTAPVRISGEAQGTYYSVIYYDSLQRDLRPQIDSLLDEFDLTASLWVDNSEICHVNGLVSSIPVSPLFADIFQKSMQIEYETDGCFNCRIAPLVSAYGFARSQRMELNDQQRDSLLELCHSRVWLDTLANGTIMLKKQFPEAKLDFNAIAQGYSVDLLCDYLSSIGLSSFLVDVGGEVRTVGHKPNGDSWIVGVERPSSDKYEGRAVEVAVGLSNLSIVTSGSYRKYYEKEGVRYSHTIDPSTGRPVAHTTLSASVVDSMAWRADALATAFMVMGHERAEQWLSSHPEVSEAYFIYDVNGCNAHFATSSFQARIDNAK
ncbi:MAG: FAD:protein FMN transferase [Bacteroidales bacterium]|nr:FAD:protein FMN transferase [Bacteroidales bacterium]